MFKKILASTLLAVTLAPLSFADTAPYTKTFTISAYYSPLPCQEKYTTGSLQGDIWLNGSGVRSADNTPVFPGMLAAPKTYDFGTKMFIPGIGMAAVHDRGGAIVHAGEKNQEFDRLDVWMGYGDKGLERALEWGKRTVDVTVYGVDDSIETDVVLGTYHPSEAIPNECEIEVTESQKSEVKSQKSEVKSQKSEVKSQEVEKVVSLDPDLFYNNQAFGAVNEDVKRLQKELQGLNLFKVEASGQYGAVTENAVFKFQQTMGIVGSRDDFGAGVFGPATRSAMNKVIAERKENLAKIAKATEEYYGDRGGLIASF